MRMINFDSPLCKGGQGDFYRRLPFCMMVILLSFGVSGTLATSRIETQEIQLFSAGEPISRIEVEVLGYGIFSRTTSTGRFDLSPLQERLRQKELENIPEKITLLIKTQGNIPTLLKELSGEALRSRKTVRLDLEKLPVFQQDARQLKVHGPQVVDGKGKPISGVDIFVIGTLLHDETKDGEIHFIPYISDKIDSFDVVLSKKGYRTEIARVKIPKHKRGIEEFPLAEDDIVMRPDWYFPVPIVLHASEYLDSPIASSEINFYTNPQGIAVLAEVITEKGTHYYGSDYLPRENLSDYILSGSLALKLRSDKPNLGGYSRLSDKSNIPNFVLTDESTTRYLRVARETPAREKVAGVDQTSMSFVAKVGIIFLIAACIAILATVWILIAKVRQRRIRREEQHKATRYAKAGISFWRQLEEGLEKASSMTGVKEPLKAPLVEMTAVMRDLRDKSFEISAKISQIDAIFERLENQKAELLSMMKRQMSSEQYTSAQATADRIEQIERGVKRAETEKERLNNLLKNNNEQLKRTLDCLENSCSRILLEQQQEDLSEEVRTVLNGVVESASVDVETVVDVEELSRESESARDFEEAYAELEVGGKVTSASEIQALHEFLDARTKRGVKENA
ncbi:MAG: hypothetical protein ACE5PV_04305 [Candidatus Poribacteria bacterium]